MLKRRPKIKKIIRSNEKGFTLLEVVMAVSILTVGMLAVASMQISAMRGNTMSMAYSETTERAQDRFEKLLKLDFLTDVELTDRDGDGFAGITDTGDDADWKDESHVRYKVYWNVIEDYAGDHAMTGINTIRVIVTWVDKGFPKRYSFNILRNRI